MKYYINGFEESRRYWCSILGGRPVDALWARLRRGEVVTRGGNRFWIEADPDDDLDEFPYHD